VSDLQTHTNDALLTQTNEPLDANEKPFVAGYVRRGYVRAGYHRTVPPPPPPEIVEGEYDLDVGSPGNPRHRTAAASTRLLELAYWQPGSPWAPYDVQPVFALWNHIGLFAWSDRGVPQKIVDMVFQFEIANLQLDPISFRSVPLHANILGSVGTIERNQSRIVVPDPRGEWARRVHTDAILGMGAGLFWLVRGLYTVPALTGSVIRLRYYRRQLEIVFGDARKDFSSRADVRI
jgi:hypothetical protein